MLGRGSQLLIDRDSVIEDETLSIEISIRILLEIRKNASVELVDLVVSPIPEINRDLLAPNSPRAE
jgi:hypothetical protein